jgi:hypothetical protein
MLLDQQQCSISLGGAQLILTVHDDYSQVRALRQTSAGIQLGFVGSVATSRTIGSTLIAKQ